MNSIKLLAVVVVAAIATLAGPGLASANGNQIATIKLSTGVGGLDVQPAHYRKYRRHYRKHRRHRRYGHRRYRHNYYHRRSHRHGYYRRHGHRHYRGPYIHFGFPGFGFHLGH